MSIFSWLRYERRTVRKRRPLPQEWPLQVPAWLLWPHLLQARQHHRLVATGFRCQGEQDRQNSPHSEISERQLIVVIYRVDIYKKSEQRKYVVVFFGICCRYFTFSWHFKSEQKGEAINFRFLLSIS